MGTIFRRKNYGVGIRTPSTQYLSTVHIQLYKASRYWEASSHAELIDSSVPVSGCTSLTLEKVKNTLELSYRLRDIPS